VLRRFALVAALIVAIDPAVASQRIAIYASAATTATADASHVRTLREAMSQSLAKRTLPAGYSVDVSLIRLDVVAAGGGHLEARIELRAALSDERGTVRSVAVAHTHARGPRRDRAIVERDAIAEGARAVVKRLSLAPK
jgi:hypothetical protein